MYVGHWTAVCEEWFIERRKAIISGKATPKSPEEWRLTLRGENKTHKLVNATESAAMEFFSKQRVFV
jgi:hypothetical protein